LNRAVTNRGRHKYLSFSEAAARVLREYADGKRMHYKEIIKTALEKGLIVSKGLTPETSLTAVIGSENRRRISRGEEPRFHAYGGGHYGLTSWLPKGVERQIELNNKKVKKELLERLKSVDAKEFEKLTAEFLTRIGFENINVTKYHGDGGIDIVGELVVGDVIRTKMAVQVKKWKYNVQGKTVRELRGGLTQHEQGLIITTSGFSTGAVKEAKDPYKAPIALMDGEQMVELMVEYEVGVIKKPLSLISLTELKEETVKDIDMAKVEVFGFTRGKRYEAKLISLKQVELGGKLYRSPSGAAKSVCGYPVDGWHFWKFSLRGETKPIDYLRTIKT